MRRLDRYIFRTITLTTLITLLVLLILETFISLLLELEDLGRGTYGFQEILRFMVLTQPRRIYEIFPMALLLGGLLGMGTLAASNELVVMRAAGVSRARLIWAGLQSGLVLGLLALALGEFIAPPLEQMAETLRTSARQQSVALRAGRGFWARDGDLFVHVRAVLPDQRLTGIVLYQVNGRNELQAIMEARTGEYLAGQGRWRLDRVIRSVLGPERVVIETVGSLTLQLTLTPELLKVLATDPKDLSMRDLYHFIAHLERNGLDARHHQLAFWAKLLGPLTNLVALFVAMPFAFSSQRTASTGQRLLIGIGVGLLFFLLNRMLSNSVLLYGLPPLLGALLPPALLLAGALYGLRRLN